MTSKHGAAGRRRPRMVAALVAACFALWLAAVPGVASAAGVTPFVDCYRTNTDGTFTIVLGYTNPGTRAVTIPHGPNNLINPARFQGTQPRSFLPGTQRGAFSIRATTAELYANAYWQLDGNTLNYWSSTTATQCSPSTPLPALGNGAGIALVLVGGGAVGVVVVRRLRRTAAA